MMIRIGIYDRYLSTAGGGERYSCKMAEILSMQKDYSVDMVTDIYSDLEMVSSRLNIDLKKVNLKVFPFLSEDYARKITSGYDIFINATYLSSLSAYGKINLYLCYFPTPFDVDFKFPHRLLMTFFRYPAIWFYRFAERLNRKDFESIDVVEGLYDIKRFFLRRGSWSSGKVKIIYRDIGERITLGIKNPQSSGIENMSCRVRLSKKERDGFIFDSIYSLKNGDRQLVDIDVSGNSSLKNGRGNKEEEYLLEVGSDTFFPARSSGKKDTDTRKLGCVLYNEQKSGILKRIILKILGFIPLFLVTFPKNLSFLECYDRIIAISRYSAKWIKTLWKKESTILFPPVDTHNFHTSRKEKIILSVGRFFPQHHNKKQLELARCFIELYKDNKSVMSDYRFYIVGGVENKKEHLDYVERIEEISSGFPIKILRNLEWKKLLDLFSRASIFWHASGLKEDENRHPEKFEHFGITTVEAMAAGCVPVVINNGGQSEIIEEGVNGFLFNDLKELKAKTLMICRGEIDSRRISNNASESSKRFSSSVFAKGLLALIDEEVKKI